MSSIERGLDKEDVDGQIVDVVINYLIGGFIKFLTFGGVSIVIN